MAECSRLVDFKAFNSLSSWLQVLLTHMLQHVLFKKAFILVYFVCMPTHKSDFVFIAVRVLFKKESSYTIKIWQDGCFRKFCVSQSQKHTVNTGVLPQNQWDWLIIKTAITSMHMHKIAETAIYTFHPNLNEAKPWKLEMRSLVH